MKIELELHSEIMLLSAPLKNSDTCLQCLFQYVLLKLVLLNFPVLNFFLHCYYRTAGEENVAIPSVEDSQEVCTTSFSTSPPSQVGRFSDPIPEVTQCMYPAEAGVQLCLPVEDIV